MKLYSSTTHRKVSALPAGAAWGFVGVLAFSFTVPFTRVAVESLPSLFVGAARAAVAGLVALVVLVLTHQARPCATQWARLALVAGGVVFGFPFFTSYALISVPSNHAAVVIAFMPAATAVATVVRTGERPQRKFWIYSLLGTAAAIGFVVLSNGGSLSVGTADIYLLCAAMSAAVGYAEGGVLSRELGSWQTVSWALVISLPVSVPLTLISSSGMDFATVTTRQWFAFSYLALVSMYLGFFAWYRGLALGPMAQVSQIQLTQPVMTLVWSGLLLREPISMLTVVAGTAVVTLALGAVRSRVTVRKSATFGETLASSPAKP